MDKRETARAIVFRDVPDRNGRRREFLLIKAKKGYWQNPQGGIEDGENALQAAMRETREETGLMNLTPFPATRFDTEYDTMREGAPIHTVLTAYAFQAEDDSGGISLSPVDGHTESAWVTFGEALSKLVKYPELRSVFEEVCRKLESIG